jgi:hypothetical protein
MLYIFRNNVNLEDGVSMILRAAGIRPSDCILPYPENHLMNLNYLIWGPVEECFKHDNEPSYSRKD